MHTHAHTNTDFLFFLRQVRGQTQGNSWKAISCMRLIHLENVYKGELMCFPQIFPGLMHILSNNNFEVSYVEAALSYPLGQLSAL